MNKNVITLFGGDEAEALRVVEPLHVSGCSHLESPFRAAFRRFKPQFIVSLWQTTELPSTQPGDWRANSGRSLNFEVKITAFAVPAATADLGQAAPRRALPFVAAAEPFVRRHVSPLSPSTARDLPPSWRGWPRSAHGSGSPVFLQVDACSRSQARSLAASACRRRARLPEGRSPHPAQRR